MRSNLRPYQELRDKDFSPNHSYSGKSSTTGPERFGPFYSPLWDVQRIRDAGSKMALFFVYFNCKSSIAFDCTRQR
jgi:hypothetical protein